jgi:hypothetical protein
MYRAHIEQFARIKNVTSRVAKSDNSYRRLRISTTEGPRFSKLRPVHQSPRP